jgi:hypothetical protein
VGVLVSLRWTHEEYAAYLAGQAKARPGAAVSAADLESDAGDGAGAKNKSKEVGPQFRIHVHSRRRRRTDPDGVYAKAAIDGLTEGGLLTDDNPDVVLSVSYSQEIAQEEQTIISLALK